MADIIISEAKRCLQCKKPFCKVGCPVNTPFNEVVKLFLEGDILKAGEMLFHNSQKLISQRVGGSIRSQHF